MRLPVRCACVYAALWARFGFAPAGGEMREPNQAEPDFRDQPCNQAITYTSYLVVCRSMHCMHCISWRRRDVCSWDDAAFTRPLLPGGFSASHNPSRKGVEKLDGLHELMLADVARLETVR